MGFHSLYHYRSYFLSSEQYILLMYTLNEKVYEWNKRLDPFIFYFIFPTVLMLQTLIISLFSCKLLNVLFLPSWDVESYLTVMSTTALVKDSLWGSSTHIVMPCENLKTLSMQLKIDGVQIIFPQMAGFFWTFDVYWDYICALLWAFFLPTVFFAALQIHYHIHNTGELPTLPELLTGLTLHLHCRGNYFWIWIGQHHLSKVFLS